MCNFSASRNSTFGRTCPNIDLADKQKTALRTARHNSPVASCRRAPLAWGFAAVLVILSEFASAAAARHPTPGSKNWPLNAAG